MPEYIINTASMDIDRKNEIVRCRDCKHYYEHSEEDLVYCINRPILRGDKYVETEPYGYCAWGEKRVDD